MSEPYLIPRKRLRIETAVSNSRFITTIDRVETADAAKSFLKSIREEMPDANHHVYAFRVGYGNSVIEGMSDDGEPSGTAGPPVLAVLRGTEIGDVIVVVTRFFGGTKLGTGGLVRAYSDAARTGLSELEVERKIDRVILGVDVNYSLFEQTKRLIDEYDGDITDEEFAADVSLIVIFPTSQQQAFTDALVELSAGRAAIVELGKP